MNHEDDFAAYNFLIAHKGELEIVSNQVYNFLYCLAALCNEKEATFSFLEEAVIKKGMWYRPEVFCDDDLLSI